MFKLLWTMMMTVLLSWGIILGGGWAMIRLAPHWTSIGPWVASAAYIIMLSIAMTLRFESGAWRRIDLLGRGAAVPIAEHMPAATEVVPPAPAIGPDDDDRKKLN